ncbi:unnamed protein product [Tetraodon nigroviridis]|uniref:(spotted green pufferfish) hypothetical protein n=1 Tax=Tetraodon nigroviridis TaxID=99883 RepID=Q4T977_TETNG|nr:unnamed protein product [Tetraodon nigroviridis]
MIQAGVAGFKCFLIPSGVEEFPHVTDSDLHAAMRQLRGTGSVLLPLEQIQAARQAGAPLTVETTHHYLSLCAEHIPAGATQFKCCPPIRDSINQAQLWSALKAGHIDMVVSDHSPCTPDLKNLESGDFTQAWGGISSLQFGLPLFWTSASKRGFELADVVRLLSKRTAQLCGLDGVKGSLAPGYDADLVVWDPERAFQITEEHIHHKNKLSPYLGAKLQGAVRATIVRGRLVYREGSFCPEPVGKHLLLPQRKHPTRL